VAGSSDKSKIEVDVQGENRELKDVQEDRIYLIVGTLWIPT
jgi:hypothetical protein